MLFVIVSVVRLVVVCQCFGRLVGFVCECVVRLVVVVCVVGRQVGFVFWLLLFVVV